MPIRPISVTFFLLGSFALKIYPIKSVEYALPQKNFATGANFFLHCSFLFRRTSVSSQLNKESILAERTPAMVVAGLLGTFVSLFFFLCYFCLLNKNWILLFLSNGSYCYVAFYYFKVYGITLDVVINNCVEFGNLSSFILIEPENSLLLFWRIVLTS